MPPQVIWRFADEGKSWRVSLASDFVTIETTDYESRDHFFTRFETIVAALAEHIDRESWIETAGLESGYFRRRGIGRARNN